MCVVIGAGSLWAARIFARRTVAPGDDAARDLNVAVLNEWDQGAAASAPRVERFVRALAASRPADLGVPVPENADRLPTPPDPSAEGMLAMYRTRDSMSAVTTFFTNRMPPAGWSLAGPPATTHGWLARYTRGGDVGMIHCSRDNRRDETIIVVRVWRANGAEDTP